MILPGAGAVNKGQIYTVRLRLNSKKFTNLCQLWIWSVMTGSTYHTGSYVDLDPTSLDLTLYFWPWKMFSACSIFSEEVYLDLLCSSVREPEPEPFFEKVGAGTFFQKSHTAPQHWFCHNLSLPVSDFFGSSRKLTLNRNWNIQNWLQFPGPGPVLRSRSTNRPAPAPTYQTGSSSR